MAFGNGPREVIKPKVPVWWRGDCQLDRIHICQNRVGPEVERHCPVCCRKLCYGGAAVQLEVKLGAGADRSRGVQINIKGKRPVELLSGEAVVQRQDGGYSPTRSPQEELPGSD